MLAFLIIEEQLHKVSFLGEYCVYVISTFTHELIDIQEMALLLGDKYEVHMHIIIITYKLLLNLHGQGTWAQAQ